MNAETVDRREAVTEAAEYGLWIGKEVLTIAMGQSSLAFEPTLAQTGHLNKMIQGLARAAKSVVVHAEDDKHTEFVIQPIEDIADAIILLSQLATAVQDELNARN